MADDGGFKMPDLGNLVQLAQDMQRKVADVQAQLAAKTCEASAGGGMVTATVNGQYDVVSIRIDPEVVDPADVAMLEDLVTAAVNQAIEKVREMTKAEMAKLTGGLAIPGMPQLF
ncbi:MAG: YbaB/EbfC family nucleoid-associated protein [Deltaproteobacteria bacterium]|nr:MAG: YbaB/EbfC family nucleoid-associated protein [Deltaproteobacteria bacterium]